MNERERALRKELEDLDKEQSGNAPPELYPDNERKKGHVICDDRELARRIQKLINCGMIHIP